MAKAAKCDRCGKYGDVTVDRGHRFRSLPERWHSFVDTACLNESMLDLGENSYLELCGDCKDLLVVFLSGGPAKQ